MYIIFATKLKKKKKTCWSFLNRSLFLFPVTQIQFPIQHAVACGQFNSYSINENIYVLTYKYIITKLVK